MPLGSKLRPCNVRQRTYTLEMLDHSCPICAALWRDYSRATTEHVRLIEVEKAAAGRDGMRFRELEINVETAGVQREQARTNIKVHMWADHGDGEDPELARGTAEKSTPSRTAT